PRVSHPLLTQNARPCILRIAKNKRRELRRTVFCGRCLPWCTLLAVHPAIVRKVGADVISSSDQADHRQDDESHQAKPTAAEATARLASPVLDVTAKSTRSPSHSETSVVRGRRGRL